MGNRFNNREMVVLVVVVVVVAVLVDITWYEDCRSRGSNVCPRVSMLIVLFVVYVREHSMALYDINLFCLPLFCYKTIILNLNLS